MRIKTIEQYEETKITLAKRKLHLDRGTYLGSQVENVREVISHLEADLLQYRREHNIFEKDDFIVFDVSKPFCAKLPTDLMKIKNPKYQEHDMIVHMNNQIYVVDGRSVRHAEPEEIQAGRRLGVCGG